MFCILHYQCPECFVCCIINALNVLYVALSMQHLKTKALRPSMILHQPLHGTALYPIHTEMLQLCRHVELLTIIIGDAAYRPHFQVSTFVSNQVASEKRPEILHHQVMYLGDVEMLMNKSRHTGQITIRKRTSIDTLDDIRHRLMAKVKIFLQQSLRHQSLAQRACEEPAQRGATALVAKDKPQRWRVFHDMHTIIKTRIAACTKNAGNAGLRAKKCTGGTQQVTLCLDRSFSKDGSHHLTDTWPHLRTKTRSIKKHVLHTSCSGIHRWEQFITQDMLDLVI